MEINDLSAKNWVEMVCNNVWVWAKANNTESWSFHSVIGWDDFYFKPGEVIENWWKVLVLKVLEMCGKFWTVNWPRSVLGSRLLHFTEIFVHLCAVFLKCAKRFCFLAFLFFFANKWTAVYIWIQYWFHPDCESLCKTHSFIILLTTYTLGCSDCSVQN